MICRWERRLSHIVEPCEADGVQGPIARIHANYIQHEIRPAPVSIVQVCEHPVVQLVHFPWKAADLLEQPVVGAMQANLAEQRLKNQPRPKENALRPLDNLADETEIHIAYSIKIWIALKHFTGEGLDIRPGQLVEVYSKLRGERIGELDMRPRANAKLDVALLCPSA